MKGMKKGFSSVESQRGSSKLSAVLWIGALAAIIYVIARIAPVYILNYQIQNLFEVNANRIETTPIKDIKADITYKLQVIHAPITIDDVVINQNSPVSVTISAQYSVSVKFVDDFKITFNLKPEATTEVQ